MSDFRTTLVGYATYRGREGHWSFLLHRITGLGVVLFLTIHIIDIAFVYFNPTLFMKAIEVYRSTLFGIGEIFLVFCVFYHGVNGLRIAYLDLFKPQGWHIESQRRSARWTLGIALILWLPSALWMLRSLLMHNYGLFSG